MNVMAVIYIDGKKEVTGVKGIESIRWKVEAYEKLGFKVTVKGCKGYAPNVNVSDVLDGFAKDKKRQVRTYQSYECPKCGQVGLRQVTAVYEADGSVKIKSVGLVHYDTLSDADGSVVATKANNFDDIEHTTKARFHDFTDDPSAIGFVGFAGTVPLSNPAP